MPDGFSNASEDDTQKRRPVRLSWVAFLMHCQVRRHLMRHGDHPHRIHMDRWVAIPVRLRRCRLERGPSRDVRCCVWLACDWLWCVGLRRVGRRTNQRRGWDERCLLLQQAPCFARLEVVTPWTHVSSGRANVTGIVTSSALRRRRRPFLSEALRLFFHAFSSIRLSISFPFYPWSS